MDVHDYKFFNTRQQGISIEEVVRSIVRFVQDGLPDRYRYRIIVTSDAVAKEGKGQIVPFATAVIVHRIGHGAIFFVTRTTRDDIPTFRDRIYNETMLSITLAQEIRDQLKEYLHDDYLRSDNFVIDADVGENGKSKILIREIVGMIQGNGFNARIKPEGIGVRVADKYVRPTRVPTKVILKPA